MSATDNKDGSVIVSVNDSKVNMAIAGKYEVTFTATDTSGNKAEVTVYVTVGTVTSIYDTIAMALEKDPGQQSTIQGVYTGLVGNGTFAFQDETGSIAVYTPTLSLVVGKEYVISGTRAEFNGLQQLSTATIVETLGNKDVEPYDIDDVGITSTALDGYQSRLVSVSNMKVISRSADTNGTITIRLRSIDGTEIDLRSDNRFPSFTSIASILNALVINESYDFVVHIGWYNVAQFIFDINSEVKDHGIDPGDITVTPIASLHSNIKDGSHIMTQGVISGYYETSEFVKVLIENNSVGIMVNVPIAMKSLINDDDEIIVKATKSTLTGQAYLTDVTNIEFVRNTGGVSGKTVTKDDLYSNKNYHVNVFGYLAETYTASQTSFILKTPQGDIKLYIPSDLNQTAKNVIIGQLSGKPAGTYVKAIGIANKTNAEEAVLLTGGTNTGIFLETGSNEILANTILHYLVLPVNGAKVGNNITLPTTGLFGSTIIWTSDEPSIISNTGIYTAPENNTNVVLDYVIKNSSNTTIHSSSITINALKGGSTYTGNYYDSINMNLTGSALKTQLTTLVTVMTLGTYGDANNRLKYTDVDPNNSSNVLLIYNRASVNGTWDSGSTYNKEHVWPQSMLGASASNGTANVASDLHNLRPANPSINSSRGNKPFADKVGGGTHGAVSGGYYPGDDDRGDVARIIFYMNTRWNLNINLVGNLDTLIKWHGEDPVDEFEMHRNDVIYGYQKNRNPYIDLPELVYSVYVSVSGTSVSVILDEDVNNTNMYADFVINYEYCEPIKEYYFV